MIVPKILIKIFCLFLEFETILTSLELNRKDKKKFLLDNAEQERIENILKKAVDKESGKLSQVDAGFTEDNPDGRELIKYHTIFEEILS